MTCGCHKLRPFELVPNPFANQLLCKHRQAWIAARQKFTIRISFRWPAGGLQAMHEHLKRKPFQTAGQQHGAMHADAACRQ